MADGLQPTAESESSCCRASAAEPDGEEQQDESSRGAHECPVCLQTYVHPVKLPCSHVFCFLCIKGVANHSKRCALCRSEIPPDFLLRPKLVNTDEVLSTPPFDGKYQWFYEGVRGWWQYDVRASAEIEDRYQKGEKVFEMLIAGFLYVVDFENMMQYRRNTPSRRRRIKRDLCDIPDKKGVAGLKCRLHAPKRTIGDGEPHSGQQQQQQQQQPHSGVVQLSGNRNGSPSDEPDDVDALDSDVRPQMDRLSLRDGRRVEDLSEGDPLGTSRANVQRPTNVRVAQQSEANGQQELSFALNQTGAAVGRAVRDGQPNQTSISSSRLGGYLGRNDNPLAPEAVGGDSTGRGIQLDLFATGQINRSTSSSPSLAVHSSQIYTPASQSSQVYGEASRSSQVNSQPSEPIRIGSQGIDQLNQPVNDQTDEESSNLRRRVGIHDRQNCDGVDASADSD